MPELPEVETVRRGLEPVMRGRRFVHVTQRRKDLRFPLPERFAERLTGRKVERLDRRAKYILIHLDGAEVLAVHLGMTGRFQVELPARRRRPPSPLVGEGRGGGDPRRGGNPPTPIPSPQGGGGFQLGDYTYEHGHDAKHDHLVFEMSGGARVTFNDARRFGYMTLIPEMDLASDAFFRGLGVEPLGADLDPAYLARRALGKKTDLKAFLMDQRIVAGLGNIYVCEALLRAGLSPFKPAARLATRTGRSDAFCRPAGAGHQGGTSGRHPRRRLHLAGLQAGRRLRRRLPERVPGLRPGGRALRQTGLPGHRAPQDAGRTLHLLLPRLPALTYPRPDPNRWSTGMAYETIIVETKGRVGIVRLNRPNALNALNAQVINELSAALDTFEADDGIGCIVITGSDKAFAAGADIKEMQAKTYMSAYKEDFITKWYRVSDARKPIIAAVAGFALGGGCELAMMCDIIIAADTAKFGQPEIKLGVMPGSGGTQRLIRQIGKAKAMELCLTGRMMDAAEAERANLVARVVPAASLMEEAMKTAETIASMSLPVDHDVQGDHQPRLRDHARRGHPLRAAGLPLHVRYRRPEGRHGRLRREAQTQVRAQIDRALYSNAKPCGHWLLLTPGNPPVY